MAMAYAQPSFTGTWVHDPPAEPAPTTRVVRMECTECGSHVVVPAASRLGGQCTNCGSYELRAVRFEDQRTDPPVTPEQRSDTPAPW